MKLNENQNGNKKTTENLQNQNESLKKQNEEQKDNLDRLDMELKTLKVTFNPLEMDKEALNRTIQQKSMVIA